MKCDNCKKHDDCAAGSGLTWPCGAYAPKVITNAEKLTRNIRELAKAFVSAVTDGCPPKMDWSCWKDEDGWDSCEECWLRYLQQPAEGE